MVDYFDLCYYNNLMVKYLMLWLYGKLCDKVIVSGFILDVVIQIGVDNLGYLFILIVGVVVGDEEFYDIFVELFDFIIEECYNGFKKIDLYKIDLDFFKISGGKFDECYVLLLCVCIG